MKVTVTSYSSAIYTVAKATNSALFNRFTAVPHSGGTRYLIPREIAALAPSAMRKIALSSQCALSRATLIPGRRGMIRRGGADRTDGLS